MRWFSIDDPLFGQFPPWMKSFGVSKQEGEVYLPAAIAGPEELVLIKASASGIAPAMRHEHSYFPAEWLATEFPGVQEVCRRLLTMTENVRPTDLQCVVRYIELAAMSGELDDAVMSRTMDGENYSRRQITDATWFIPIALGRRVLANKGISFSATFHVFSPEGNRVREGLFAENRIYAAAYDFRSRVPSEAVVRKLAHRSPEVLGYRQSVMSGSRSEDLRTVPIIFFTETPSETGLRRAHDHAQEWVRGRAT